MRGRDSVKKCLRCKINDLKVTGVTWEDSDTIPPTRDFRKKQILKNLVCSPRGMLNKCLWVTPNGSGELAVWAWRSGGVCASKTQELGVVGIEAAGEAVGMDRPLAESVQPEKKSPAI